MSYDKCLESETILISDMNTTNQQLDLNYQQYAKRYRYDPSLWPPDLGLAQLHARCSESGLNNLDGVQCPCCDRWSKKVSNKWWKRSINEDLTNKGTAIPGYFQLLRFYAWYILLILLVNSIYPIYATYYTCNHLDPDKICIKVGFMYYLEFNQMIGILSDNYEQQMVDNLEILQTVVFYLLLFANNFSIFFITYHNPSARMEIKQKKSSNRSRLLFFYNVPKNVSLNLAYIMKQIIKAKNAKYQFSKNEQNNFTQERSMKILKVIQIYQLKRYCKYFNLRNQLFFKILSFQVIPKEPFSVIKYIRKLRQYHEIVMQQKKKIGVYDNKFVAVFEDIRNKNLVHKMFRLNNITRWYYGFRTVLKQLKIMDFKQQEIKSCTFRLVEGSDLKWENYGEALGVRMASRIKAFIVAIILIGTCYAILYFPMRFALTYHERTTQQVQTTVQKLIPNLVSILLVIFSISFRTYMQKLSSERNPKDQVQNSRFLLLSTLIFHTIFFVLVPIVFFLVKNGMDQTTKLYVIQGQSRTFIIVQLIIVLVDVPYRLWKSKKIKTLSDQRYAFRYNQQMLHKIVESRDYPLQTRVDVMFRFWSFALFYSFILPYMLVYLVIGMTIIYWVQKKNLYSHYGVRRKISIRLFSQILMYFMLFYSVLSCLTYCYTMKNNKIQILLAVLFTACGMVLNIIYWLVLNKGDENAHRYSNTTESQRERKDQQLKELQRQSAMNKSYQSSHSSTLRQSFQLHLSDKNSEKKERDQTIEINQRNYGQQFYQEYHKFLKKIQNDKLDHTIQKFLTKLQEQDERMTENHTIQLNRTESQYKDIENLRNSAANQTISN